MKFSVFIIVCDILFFTQEFVHIQGKTCKEAVSELTKRQLKRVTECTGKLKFKNGKEKTERKTCVMKCVLEAEGILGSDGFNDPIGTMVFVESNVPFEQTAWAREAVMGCLETTAKLDPTENNCKTYEPLAKCSLASLGLFCTPPKE